MDPTFLSHIVHQSNCFQVSDDVWFEPEHEELASLGIQPFVYNKISTILVAGFTARVGPELPGPVQRVRANGFVECSAALVLCDRLRSGAEDSRCKTAAHTVCILLQSEVR